MSDTGDFLVKISIWVLPTIFAIILHEVMHGVVALRLGDDTALEAGRLTLNPIPHIDPFGTVILPMLLLWMRMPVFGFARPVPVNFSRLRNGRRGMMMVAAAGPLTNIALAIVSSLALRIDQGFIAGPLGNEVARPLLFMLGASVVVNVVLAIFNLFPLLPLDGGRVMVGILPLDAARAFARMEPLGFPILFLLLYTGVIDRVIDPIINTVTQILL
ncbi:MAG TPA: site-2 protease family protein [Candidatus Binataceae bacterium]|nr:site-2 protease family protein [Candidatus Binataceae bacterium]